MSDSFLVEYRHILQGLMETQIQDYLEDDELFHELDEKCAKQKEKLQGSLLRDTDRAELKSFFDLSERRSMTYATIAFYAGILYGDREARKEMDQ